jgi:deoxyribodipyrimidine photo-lyase
MPAPPPTTDSRIHAGPSSRPVSGEFVLYWIQTTMRARENPALNFAAEQANALRLPLVVYQGLRPDYPWASDRLHTFILESAADLVADFAARGIPYGFHLERRRRAPGEPAPPSPLEAMARRAALVVTDYFPTFIVPRQTRRLRERIAAPVVAVDGCTIVPMAHISRQHPTARGFRTEVAAALPHFLHLAGDVEPDIRNAIEFPFERTRPGTGTMAPAALAAACDIDHGVGPSPVIRGGPRAARARLVAFLETGLARYAEDRGDPNRPEAVSGLSPYLHFGNISPQEVLLRVRDVAPAEQYARFEDELLVWRELAHNFCHHDPRHRTLSAIPEWARKELDDHSADPRPAGYPLEALERSGTASPLWNAAQRAYVRDGAMHNYLRMLWGKAILHWSADAGTALRTMEHLNNKYSLDGRDPNSYAGIHWILGKFDRPFYRRPVFGTVRYMSLTAAEKKFDVKGWLASEAARDAPGGIIREGGTPRAGGRARARGSRARSRRR